MLEPININLFFFTIFFIKIVVSLVHLVTLPSMNFPEDFPCPEYSKARKPNFFFFANFKKVFGFFRKVLVLDENAPSGEPSIESEDPVSGEGFPTTTRGAHKQTARD